MVNRCRHDVTLIEAALSEAADWPTAGLLARIEQVADEMRGRGLDVRLTASAGPRAAPGGGPALAVPAPAAAAVAHAVREALANVLLHAGTSLAWVEVSLAGDVLVRVRDAGAGLRPGPGSTRPGWACAGPSSSGWPTRAARRPSGPPRDQARWCACAGRGATVRGPLTPAGRGRPCRRMTGWSGRPTRPELPRMMAGVAIIWQFATLIQVVAYLRDYRDPVIPVRPGPGCWAPPAGWCPGPGGAG